MLRSTSLIAILALTTAISACGKHGNGPAVNPPEPVTAAGNVDVSTAKGIWVVESDIREFRKTGRVDGLCRRNPKISVQDSTCVIDADGSIFYYAEKSWSASSRLQVGKLDGHGHVSFLKLASRPYDHTFYADSKISGDLMTWDFKHEGRTNEVQSTSVFTRSTSEEVRSFAKAIEACRGGDHSGDHSGDRTPDDQGDQESSRVSSGRQHR